MELPVNDSEAAAIFVLYVGDNNLYIDTYGAQGQPKSIKSMDVAPMMKNDRVYLPARYIAELYNYEVGWDEETRTVLIGLPGNLPSLSISEST